MKLEKAVLFHTAISYIIISNTIFFIVDPQQYNSVVNSIL